MEGAKAPDEYDRLRNRWIVIFSVIVFFILFYFFISIISQTKNESSLTPQNSTTKSK